MIIFRRLRIQVSLGVAVLLCTGVAAQGIPALDLQQPPVEQKPAEPSVLAEKPQPKFTQREEPQQTHRFWDRKNVLLFTGAAASRAFDYASTRDMRDRGRDEILLTNEIVDNKPAFIAIEAAGAATNVLLSYWAHRKGHHKIERWLSIVHISVTTFGAIRNYNLKSAPGFPP